MGKNRQGEEYSFDWNYDMFSPYLSFEGENLNGKKNGKGIEWDSYEKIYEGEYVIGKEKIKKNTKKKNKLINIYLFI